MCGLSGRDDIPSSMITTDMRAVIEAVHLCFAATVTPDGHPNLSPKGTIRVWDDTHLFFLDIASPNTRANLQHSPWMELNVVEQLSRRGYRFFGKAEVHEPGTAIYEEGMSRVFDPTIPSIPVAAVVRLEVQRTAPLLSPGYWSVDDENALREIWRARRKALDEEFEAHIARVGPVRVESAPRSPVR
jgi:uncharacterized protein